MLNLREKRERERRIQDRRAIAEKSIAKGTLKGMTAGIGIGLSIWVIMIAAIVKCIRQIY